MLPPVDPKGFHCKIPLYTVERDISRCLRNPVRELETAVFT